MEESSAPTETVPEVPITEEQPEQLSLVLEHLKSGYDTAQRVIELMDTKGNILIGLATVVAGFGGALFRWILELAPAHPASWPSISVAFGCGAKISLLFLLLSLLAYVLVVIACLFSVIARHAQNGPTTLLFPVPRSKTTDRAHLAAIRVKITSCDSKAVLEEYAEQLARVGMILGSKLRNNCWASWFAVAQVVFTGASVARYFFMATSRA